MNRSEDEPFGSLYAARQKRAFEQRQALNSPNKGGNAMAIVNGARCPENSELPASACFWHDHEGEHSNLCHRDKLFEFKTTFVRPGTEIRTKGQWKRFCKRYNYVEIPMKERIDMVSHGFAERKRRERTDALRQTARKVFGEALPSLR